MARIVFRTEAVEALKAVAERLGISMDDAANNAVLVYRDMIFKEPEVKRSVLDDYFASTDIGRLMKRRVRQREIEDEERDIAFHRNHDRPYTPIR